MVDVIDLHPSYRRVPTSITWIWNIVLVRIWEGKVTSVEQWRQVGGLVCP